MNKQTLRRYIFAQLFYWYKKILLQEKSNFIYLLAVTFCLCSILHLVNIFFVRIKKWGNRSQLRFFGWRTKLKSSESSFAFSCLLFVFVRWWMLGNHSTYKMSSCTFKTYSLTKRHNCQISKKLWNQYFHEIAVLPNSKWFDGII